MTVDSLPHRDDRHRELSASCALENEPAQVFILRQRLEPLADELLVDDDAFVRHVRRLEAQSSSTRSRIVCSRLAPMFWVDRFT